MDAQNRKEQISALKELKNDLEQFFLISSFNHACSTSSDNLDESENFSVRQAQNGRLEQALASFYSRAFIDDLYTKRDEIQEQLNDLRSNIGKKAPSMEQLDPTKVTSSKTHWDFVIKEMKWMAEDFEREHKKKITDSKKQGRSCKKQLHEKKLKKEKELKDQKIELRKKAQNMSRMVQQYWKSVEKVVKHNYNVLYEKKRQQIRSKKLESFVSKHLKLSVRVAEELNTKSFMEQSMMTKDAVGGDGAADNSILQKRSHSERDQNTTIVKLYNSQDEFGKTVQADPLEQHQAKRQKIAIYVKKDVKTGLYEVDEEYEEELKMHSQVLSQGQNNEEKHMSRTLIAEQTVEMAKSFQPTGFTLSSVNVKTKVPFLLQGSLREYQIIGLDWLVTLHNKKLNGILADEMGLGKTIQTISMLASLACDKGVWGPHLIVVPTTIIINWEMEFKKWCPAFKILTYFGSQKERKMKRHGWSKENSFHVCITSYKLVIQDHFAFRRKKWYYMVLDEAQNIKNFKSQRWQTLLRFNTKRRLLLTGTPLQNDVMELWSLMHFLMPNIFSSQQDFKEWFSNPFNQSITQNQSLNITVVQKLQSILRPFLLRRMKRDVEKQLPEKVEHIVQCNLSRRQRLLYDEYINSDKTKHTLQDSDFFSIMNILMQLRKVCNHPDLFEPRTIESPFIMQKRVTYHYSSSLYKTFQYDPLKDVNFKSLNFVITDFENLAQYEYDSYQELYPKRSLVQVIGENKDYIDHLSDHLLQTRPLIDGYAIGKRLPINCNVLSKSNTKNLMQTLPSVLSPDSMAYHEIPTYLNTACLPFAQHYYSMDKYDEMRFSQRGKKYNEFDVYLSALKDDEQRYYLIKFAQKLQQWRAIDHVNRVNLIFRKPVYGEDCRRAVKCNLLFSDVFDVKRNKNLDKTTKSNQSLLNDLFRAPSSVFNPFAQTQEILYNPNGKTHYINIVEDWPEFGQDLIENNYRNNTISIKEVPLSLQIKNKKKKQQLKQQFLEQQKQLLQQQIQQQLQNQQQQQQVQEIEEKVQYKEQQISVIIDMKALKESDEGKEEAAENEDSENKFVEVKIEEVVKERIEIKKIENVIDNEALSKQILNNVMNQINGTANNNQDVQMNGGMENESPYQRIYQNAAKRFKNKELIDKDIDGSSDMKMGDQEMQDQTSGLSTMPVNQQIENGNLNSQENQNEEQKSPQKGIESIIDSNIINGQANKVDQPLDSNQQNQQQNQTNQINQLTNNINLLQQLNPTQSNPLNAVDNVNSDSPNYQITYRNCEVLRDLIVTPLQRVQNLEEVIKHYKFIIPKCVAKPVDFIPSKIITEHEKDKAYERFAYQKLMSHRNVNQSLKYSNILFFPHKNLIQYDCGKLQRLASLLKNLHSKGHKVLIFTQMTRILDILEQFLNLHGYTYVRLDGSVKVEMRQRLVDKFNLNKKIFCFISSTRCGGIGINLTGADCVIFYDTDWNPAMDKQAQDRCHRIGQTKTVHIYRLISINTIEENIFKKSLQKRDFGGLIIEGNFDMEIFKKVSLKELLEDENILKPQRRNLLEEENIVFHTNTSAIGVQGDELGEQPNELDFEKQREIEVYRKRFEEALVRIEDKEDVIALQQAKREVDDEFDEDAIINQEGTTNIGKESTEQMQVDEEGNPVKPEVTKEKEKEEFEAKGANQLQKELKKSEFIDWRNNQSLNEVTKMTIDYFEKNYSFDKYLEDRAKKDNKFINPLNDEEEKAEKKDKDREDGNDSEFSLSDEDEEMSNNGEAAKQKGEHDQHWDRMTADMLYKRTREEIESKYFVM